MAVFSASCLMRSPVFSIRAWRKKLGRFSDLGDHSRGVESEPGGDGHVALREQAVGVRQHIVTAALALAYKSRRFFLRRTTTAVVTAATAAAATSPPATFRWNARRFSASLACSQASNFWRAFSDSACRRA